MVRRVWFVARFGTPDGDYRRVPIKFHKNGKAIKPDPPVGSYLVQYQIRIAQKYVGVGKDFDAAASRFRLEQSRIEAGVTAETALNPQEYAATSVAKHPNSKTKLAEASIDFVKELKTLNRKKYSVAMYENALRDFQRSCDKTFVEDIERNDVLYFLAWMRHNMKVRVPGSEERTYKNKLNYLGTFLARHDIQLKKDGNKQSKNDPGLLYRT